MAVMYSQNGVIVRNAEGSGGLIYKGYFNSQLLSNCIDTNTAVFNNKFKFIPYPTSNNLSYLTVETELLRKDKWEINIEFYFTRYRNNYCMSGEFTSNWWKCIGVNVDYVSSLNKYGISVLPGVTASGYWENNSIRSRNNGIFIIPNQLNSIKVIHHANTDNYSAYLNDKLIGTATEVNSYYGSVKFAIGGIYNNNNSFLFCGNPNSEYITSRSYIKVNDQFSNRPW